MVVVSREGPSEGVSLLVAIGGGQHTAAGKGLTIRDGGGLLYEIATSSWYEAIP